MENYDFKKQDVLNRRQAGRRAKSLHDITCARYFQIDNGPTQFITKSMDFDDPCPVTVHDNQKWETVGFMKPDRNKIIFSFRKYGILFESRIPLSKIMCYGEKLPYHYN